MWAVGADRAVFRIVLTNVLLGLATGCVLIGNYGLHGAAICAVIGNVVNIGQHYYLFTRNVSALNLSSEIIRLSPAVAATMGIIVFLPISKLISVPIALLCYLFLVLVWNDRFSLALSAALPKSPA
jgi:O-antigen/teichoic acid export membrane protein